MIAAEARVPGLPVIGNLLEMRRNLVDFMVRIGREYGDVARSRQGIFNALMVQGPGPMHEVLVEKNDAFVKSYALSVFSRPMLGNGLLTSEHEEHRVQRKRLAPAFAHKRVAAYGAIMKARADACAERMLRARRVDASEEMMRTTLEIVGKTLFDADVGRDAEVIGEVLTEAMRHLLKTLFSLVPIPPQVPTPRNVMALRNVKKLDAIVYRVIEERRRHPDQRDRGDVLSILLAPDEDGHRIDDREVRDQVMTLMMAGHETTANALAWALAEVARHPAMRAKLEAEADRVWPEHDASANKEASFEETATQLRKLSYAAMVMKEAMRLYPPAYAMGRLAEKSVTIGGMPVKKGGIVVVNIIGMHRRDDLYPNALAFEPERFSEENEKKIPKHAYQPFGGGPRVCIGNQFALMEGQLVLGALARRVRLDLAGPFPDGEPLVTLRPKGGVPMRVTARD